MPMLHVLAGPSGAGKSQYYRYMVERRYPTLPFIDLHASEAPAPAAADAWCESLCMRMLEGGRSFVVETQLSHPSQLRLLQRARSLGYETTLYALCIDDPRVLHARMHRRSRTTAEGPSEQMMAHYVQCLANLRRAVRLADVVYLLDAIEAREGGPRLTASITMGRLQLHTYIRPKWAQQVLLPAEP